MKKVKSTIPSKYIKLLNDSINESYNIIYQNWRRIISGGKGLFEAAELEHFESDFNKESKTSLYNVLKKSIRKEFEQNISSYTDQQKAERYINDLVKKSFYYYYRILRAGAQINLHQYANRVNESRRVCALLKKQITTKIPPEVFPRANQLFEKHKKENEKYDKDGRRITLKYCLLESVHHYENTFPAELKEYAIPFAFLTTEGAESKAFNKLFANYKKWRKRIRRIKSEEKPNKNEP